MIPVGGERRPTEGITMLRVMICCVALFAFAPTVRAGELDREGGAAKPVAAAPLNPVAKAPTGSEMDRESPQDANFFRGHWGGWGHGGFGWGHGGFGWGGWGFRPHFGWGGWGHRGFGWGGPFVTTRFFSPGFFGHRSFAWAWPGAFHNWSRVNFYPAFYPVGWYGWYW
jgi:hypothetical protein